MCDYSLHSVASRPAKVGDKLVTTKFSNTLTRGFASMGEPNVAICLLPGTELAFDDDVTYTQSWSLLRGRKQAANVARFRQIDMDKPSVHHDALEFPDGLIVLVNQLLEGQHATVLQMPASGPSVKAAQKHREGTPGSILIG